MGYVNDYKNEVFKRSYRKCVHKDLCDKDECYKRNKTIAIKTELYKQECEWFSKK